VRICSLYGAGFFYIPGTDTCIKLGGYLRVDTTFNGSIYDQPAWSGDLGQGNRYRDYFAARSRMALTIDTRTATEYGVVRTFGQADFQFSTLGSSTYNPNSLNTSLLTTTSGGQIAGGLVANNPQLLDTPGGGYVAVEMVFLQFAGFTFGKSASAYATPWHGYPGNNTSFLLGGHDTVTGVNNIQYSAQFGNGVSGTIGLDDPTVFNRTAVYNLAAPLNTSGFGAANTLSTAFLGALGTSANSYGGVYAPDIVGNIRVDQAWGLFQISAAAHLVNGSYNGLGLSGLPSVASAPVNPFGASEPSGHPDSKWGGSVMAALQIKNIPTGAGDDFKIDASWAKGDTKNVISTSATSPNFAMFSGTGRADSYQSVGFGVATDAMWLPAFGNRSAAVGDGNLHLTTAYGIRGAFNHNWDPYWSTSVFGSYSAVRYDDYTKAVYCATYSVSAATGGNGVVQGASKSADYSCNPDYNVAQVGIVTRWTPVKNLTFSAEAQYFLLDQKFTGASVLANMPPKPNTFYEFKDQSTVSVNVRAQRNF
jgi:Porin subfamily